MRQQNLRGLPLSRTPPMVAVKRNGVLVAEAKFRTLFKDPLSATVRVIASIVLQTKDL
jgi:hypothetical protein